MYPEITPLIRDAIKRRYELIPYLYSLMLESHTSAIPPQRWIGWGCEKDPEVWTQECMKGETQYWLGDTLMVGGVYEPGATTAKMYLPRLNGRDEGYVNLNAPYERYTSGHWVTIESKWRDSIPLLARIGGGVATGKNMQTRSSGDTRFPSENVVEDDYRAVEIFPPSSLESQEGFVYSWYEDDGISRFPQVTKYTLTYHASAEGIAYSLEKDGKFDAPWHVNGLHVILPFGDDRIVFQKKLQEEKRDDPVLEASSHISSKTGNVLRQEDSRGRVVWLIPGF